MHERFLYKTLVVWLTIIHYYTECAVPKHPHIIVIVADDLIKKSYDETMKHDGLSKYGWNDVSFHGSDQIPTPNIDTLASEGIILNNYYVSPICTPTRSALMTGRHPIHTGLQSGVIVGSQPYGLPLSEKILPQWLGELGYQNHMVGKWHLGMFAEEFLPTRRGFVSHYGYLQGAEGYFDHTYAVSNDGEWGLDWRRNDDIIRNEREMYSTELFTKEAVKHIKQHNKSQRSSDTDLSCVAANLKKKLDLSQITSSSSYFPCLAKVKSQYVKKVGFTQNYFGFENPLFLYIAHQAVHRGNFDDPLLAPQKYVDRFPHIHNYKRKLFAGMVAALDDSVGQIMNTLRSEGMMDNSVIVFTTDNGGPANGFDDNAANNFPLRGVKTTLWEGGVRGSGLIYSPLLKTSGYTSNHMMHVCDWLPTLYTAAGGDTSILTDSDGYSMWETLSQNGESPRTEMLHNIDPMQNNGALRMGDYKLLVGDVGMAWDGWYPPWQNPDDDGTSVQYVTEKHSTSDSGTLKFEQVQTSEYSEENLKDSLDKPFTNTGRNAMINCGEKPLNASTNCSPVVSPCLFNITKDPCEYYNIADNNQQVVIQMLVRMNEYMYTMVPPGNKNVDPAGDPKYHNQTWVPWIKL